MPDTAENPLEPDPTFEPVVLRPRHDGWTKERQIAFIKALAECGCVIDAAAHVGVTPQSAYALRRRFDAQSFRMAWDAALDYAIRRLSDAVFSRALHGVAIPHYYKGELVGEHRRYDEALARFLLKARDPLRYANPKRDMKAEPADELFAVRLARSLHHIENGTPAIRARRSKARAKKAATPL